MKKMTTGLFVSRGDAAKAINRLHKKFDIPNKDISFVYRNTEGKVKEVQAKEVSSDSPDVGASKGVLIGGALGALAGVAVITGVLPVLGAVFVAGPIATALGLTGAAATATAGVLTGAAAGGLLGGLVNLGVGQDKAKSYQDRVMAGDVLVVVYADKNINAAQELEECGATNVEVFSPGI